MSYSDHDLVTCEAQLMALRQSLKQTTTGLHLPCARRQTFLYCVADFAAGPKALAVE